MYFCTVLRQRKQPNDRVYKLKHSMPRHAHDAPHAAQHCMPPKSRHKTCFCISALTLQLPPSLQCAAGPSPGDLQQNMSSPHHMDGLTTYNSRHMPLMLHLLPLLSHYFFCVLCTSTPSGPVHGGLQRRCTHHHCRKRAAAGWRHAQAVQ
jgi:hypothetical protein